MVKRELTAPGKRTLVVLLADVYSDATGIVHTDLSPVVEIPCSISSDTLNTTPLYSQPASTSAHSMRLSRPPPPFVKPLRVFDSAYILYEVYEINWRKHRLSRPLLCAAYSRLCGPSIGLIGIGIGIGIEALRLWLRGARLSGGVDVVELLQTFWCFISSYIRPTLVVICVLPSLTTMSAFAPRATKRLRLNSSLTTNQWMCKSCQRRSFASSTSRRQQSSPSQDEKQTHFGYETVAESLKASRGISVSQPISWIDRHQELTDFPSRRSLLLRRLHLRHYE